MVAQTVKNLPAMQEAEVQSLGQEDPLQKGMATHSSVLAWRIPWAEEPSGLQSMGLHRVGHNWATNTHQILRVKILNNFLLWIWIGKRGCRSYVPLMPIIPFFTFHFSISKLFNLKNISRIIKRQSLVTLSTSNYIEKLRAGRVTSIMVSFHLFLLFSKKFQEIVLAFSISVLWRSNALLCGKQKLKTNYYCDINLERRERKKYRSPETMASSSFPWAFLHIN